MAVYDGTPPFWVYEKEWHLVDMRNETQHVDITELNAFMRDHAGEGRFLYTSSTTPTSCTFVVYCENPDTAFALKMKFG